uniref:Uncharacterized protein n=1 Tax=Siphoviridae sp. ctBLh2 TaxID=2827803 RepID=A0A8S5S456_9CAUD|nr:MAG TPA: hypothetical protein [Siphoviridae sp. ctBLh2]
MVVDTIKKKRIMKITSGSEAVEMPGKLLLPFFFITAMALLLYIYRFGLRNLQRYCFGYCVALLFVEFCELRTELALCNLVAHLVEGAGELILYHDVGLVARVAGGLQGNHALADGIGPGTAVRKLDILVRLLGQVLAVERVEDELLDLILELTKINHLLFALGSCHDVTATRDKYQIQVALLDLDLLLLLVLRRQGRKHADQTRIGVHGSGYQEENQQQEGDVGLRSSIDIWCFSFIYCHCLFLFLLESTPNFSNYGRNEGCRKSDIGHQNARFGDDRFGVAEESVVLKVHDVDRVSGRVEVGHADDDDDQSQ